MFIRLTVDVRFDGRSDHSVHVIERVNGTSGDITHHFEKLPSMKNLGLVPAQCKHPAACDLAHDIAENYRNLCCPGSRWVLPYCIPREPTQLANGGWGWEFEYYIQ